MIVGSSELKDDPNNEGVYDCQLNNSVHEEVRWLDVPNMKIIVFLHF